MPNRFAKLRLAGKWSCHLLIWLFLPQLALFADQIVYDDSLENGWQNWSWATVNLANTNPVHSGMDSISVTCGGWQALYLHNTPFYSGLYTNLTFWINGGTGGQPLKVQATTNQNALSTAYTFIAPAGSWQQIVIPLTALGVANQPNMDGFWIMANTAVQLPTFYVDDISLVANPTTPGTNAPVAITVDALANRHPISPLIYGVAWTASNQLSDLNFTLNRAGGNAETRYNWQLNAHNRAADWYFESLADSGPTNPAASDDAFVADSQNGGAQPMITIPMIGWMPKLGPNRAGLASYSIAKYGPQTGYDPWFPDAGNGISTSNNTLITWNDPNDANFPTNVVLQQGFVQHLLNQWGPSTNGGVPFYIMDNEHSIWFATHRDVHPIGPTMQEIFNDFIAYAGMVKSNDPNALVCGPEEWGWSGYFYSGYDQQWSGQHNDYDPSDYPDRQANSGWDYMPWLLNQIQQHDSATGQRLIDYFTLHCYPQEANVGGTNVDTATELLRNQCTRIFWDTNYVDPSWINSVIMLIPRMKSWVATNYPGTKIGVTEYNWGAETNINGATAQADILGIFGSQGLDLATRWTVPPTGSPTYNAMKMYRNYDGKNSVFGDTSILTTVPNPDDLSAFAAVRTSDGALTLMVINKDLNNASPITASLTNFSAAGTVQRWQLTSANVITPLANLALANSFLSDLLPAQSITLFVLPPSTSINLQFGNNSPPGQLGVWLNGEAGQTYLIQSSTDLVNWSSVSTNLLTSNSFEFFVPTTNAPQMFFRGAWERQ
jgi:hypothetical protein